MQKQRALLMGLMVLLVTVVGGSSFATLTTTSARLKQQQRQQPSTTASSSLQAPFTNRLGAGCRASLFKRQRYQLSASLNPIIMTAAAALTIRGGGVGSWLDPAVRLRTYIGASKQRCWIALFFSIAVEILATALMATAEKENSAAKLVVSLGTYLISLLAFGICLAKIDVSIAYAVWSATGTAATSAIGILCFGEKAAPSKLMFIMFIIMGVVGLNNTKS